MNSSKINQKNIHVKKNSKLMRKIEFFLMKKKHTHYLNCCELKIFVTLLRNWAKLFVTLLNVWARVLELVNIGWWCMDDLVNIGAFATATISPQWCSLRKYYLIYLILDVLYEGLNMYVFVLSIYIQLTTERSRLYTM